MRLPMVLLITLLAFPAEAQTERRYDAAGRYIGRAETRGAVTRHYDAAGRYTGRSEARGSTLRHFDRAGRYSGRSARR